MNVYFLKDFRKNEKKDDINEFHKIEEMGVEISTKDSKEVSEIDRSLEKAQKKNEEKRQKTLEERSKSNKDVLRLYKIKH